MSATRWFLFAAGLGLSLFLSEASFAQGCTAQRGCPTLPPSIPSGAAASRTTYGLINNFYASTASASFEARPTAPIAGDDVPANKALIRVSVPVADAVVSFQGVASRQQGRQRLFASPVLAGGRDYRYVIRCVWSEGGRQITRELSVVVRPGEETSADFVAAR